MELLFVFVDKSVGDTKLSTSELLIYIINNKPITAIIPNITIFITIFIVFHIWITNIINLWFNIYYIYLFFCDCFCIIVFV